MRRRQRVAPLGADVGHHQRVLEAPVRARESEPPEIVYDALAISQRVVIFSRVEVGIAQSGVAEIYLDKRVGRDMPQRLLIEVRRERIVVLKISRLAGLHKVVVYLGFQAQTYRHGQNRGHDQGTHMSHLVSSLRRVSASWRCSPSVFTYSRSPATAASLRPLFTSTPILSHSSS